MQARPLDEPDPFKGQPPALKCTTRRIHHVDTSPQAPGTPSGRYHRCRRSGGMMATPRAHVTVSETAQSPFAVRIEMGSHVITGDEPVDTGGGDLGPSPFELLSAALAECTAMTVRWYARRQGWPVEHV